jgi:Tol biopolymer transport system component
MDLARSVACRLVTLAIALLFASDATAHPRVPNEAMHRSDQPELIGPGVISTRDYERDEALSPDGHALYFTKRTIWPYFSVICVSHLVNGQWTEPEIAPFSGRYPDATPAFAPDGKTLYFASRRPVEEGATLRRDYDLWAVDATAQGWSEPRHLPAPVNSNGNDISPSVTAGGVLYFVTDVPLPRVVRAEPNAGAWSQPAVVAAPADSIGYELGVAVTSDDRYMVVTVLGREDALATAEAIYQRSDLYVRERLGGTWSALRHLPAPINSAAEEGSPSLTLDGRLLFTSERGGFTEHGSRHRSTREFQDGLNAPGNGLGDLYSIDASVAGIRR